MSDQHHRRDSDPSFENVWETSDVDRDEMFNIQHDNNDDPVYRQNRRKKIRFIATIIVLVGIVLAAGYGFWRIYDTQQQQEQQRLAEEQQRAAEEAAQSEMEPTLPLLDSYEDHTPPSTDAATITLDFDDGVMVTSEDYSLAHSEYKFVAPEVTCNVSRASDFCFAGSLNTGKDNPDVEAYFLKDAPNSRMLEDAEHFTTVDVSGANAAATMTIQLGGNDTPSLIVVHNDGTGVLLTAPNGSINDLEGLTGDLTVAS